MTTNSRPGRKTGIPPGPDYGKQYYRQNRQRILQYMKTYRIVNAEKLRTYQAHYRATHKAAARAYQVKYQPGYRARKQAEKKATARPETPRARQKRLATQRAWRAYQTIEAGI